MADNIQRYGFRYHGSRHGGGSYAPQSERFRVASGYQATDVNVVNCNLNVGDVVKKVSDGTVALAAGTDAFFGVIVNILPYWDGTAMRWNRYLPGNTVWGTNYDRASYVEVIPAWGYLFELDCNDNTTITTLTGAGGWIDAIHRNANHINTGDTTNVTANPQLNISGNNTTNTLGWRIVDISPTMENQDPSGKYFKLIVTANLTQEAAFTTTGV